MPRRTPPLLSRFPLFTTLDLTEAQRRTAAFWPGHTSEVLGPEDYAVQVFRVMAADTALTFVECTTRIRMIPSEPDTGYVLFVPLDGSVEIRAAACDYRSSPLRPLLKAPDRGERFESSPVRCLVVDLDTAAVSRAAAIENRCVPGHTVFTDAAAAGIRRHAVQLARAANLSRVLPALQAESPQDRLLAVPVRLRKLEQALITAVVVAAAEASLANADAPASCNLEPLKAWVRANLCERIQTADLAAAMGVSTKALTRLFARIGCTPQEFVRSQRLEQAHALLCHPLTPTSVTDAAYAVGYSHLGLFSRQYRRRYGELPSETLARHAAKTPPESPPNSNERVSYK